jgi:hypothetical protein
MGLELETGKQGLGINDCEKFCVQEENFRKASGNGRPMAVKLKVGTVNESLRSFLQWPRLFRMHSGFWNLTVSA